MRSKLRHIPAALCLGVALTALSLTAYASPTPRAADHEEQRAIDYLARGGDALASGQQKAALVAIEKAQTALLNAQQAGTYKAPKAMDALDSAHADVAQGKLAAAAGLVHTAEGDLHTPRIG